MNPLKVFFALICVFSTFFVFLTNIFAAPTIPPYLYISTEVGGGNNATLRGQVETQDDTWRADAAALGATSFTMMDFGKQADDGYADLQPNNPGPYPPGNPATNPLTVPDGTYFTFPTVGGISVTITLLNMDGSGVFGGSQANMTATYPRLARSSTLQDGAPRPSSLYASSSADRPRYWNEAIGSNASRNGVLIQFSQPVAAFGAWWGDVETRTDGAGTPARIQLFNSSNAMIEDQIIPTSTSNQSLCGDPVDPNYAGCGNETTRWIGFISPDVNVSAMLIIVGDDDSGGDTQGFGESISFIGATLAEGIQPPAPTQVPDEDKVLPSTGFSPGKVAVLGTDNSAAYQQYDILSLSIPKVGVEAKIVGVPFTENQWDVQWLGEKVGYLEGTSYPTWAGNTVLTGHVFDQFGEAGIFAGLDRLGYGDRVKIGAWGQGYIYEIRGVELVSPDNTEPVEQTNDGYDWLTLITCKGYDEKSDIYQWRLIVRAVLVEVIPLEKGSDTMP